MTKRKLLLCFDAFGTLFRPKVPVALQYGEVARQCGLSGFSDEQLQKSFREAFRSEAADHPNYGKASGMNASAWWTNIIHKTFQPLLLANQTIPGDLAPKLLHRFSSSEGYVLTDQRIPSLLRELKNREPSTRFDLVVVGVITNSDDRVPGILSSFGLRVSPLRFGAPSRSEDLTDAPYDIDFHCLSYDVGVEKPDRAIFAAAEELRDQIVQTRAANGAAARWSKLYVGDDYEKDALGASAAGWSALFLQDASGSSHGDLQSLDFKSAQGQDLAFMEPGTVATGNISDLLECLARPEA